MPRRLFRSTRNKMIGGVCGGLAEYFDTDPSLVRIAVVALFFTGISMIAYPIAWIILPKADGMSQLTDYNSPAANKDEHSRQKSRFWSTYFPGLLLITVGGIFLLKEFFYWIDFHDIWPVILILVGAGIILGGPWRRSRRDRKNDATPTASTLSAGPEQSGDLPK